MCRSIVAVTKETATSTEQVKPKMKKKKKKKEAAALLSFDAEADADIETFQVCVTHVHPFSCSLTFVLGGVPCVFELTSAVTPPHAAPKIRPSHAVRQVCSQR